MPPREQQPWLQAICFWVVCRSVSPRLCEHNISGHAWKEFLQNELSRIWWFEVNFTKCVFGHNASVCVQILKFHNNRIQ